VEIHLVQENGVHGNRKDADNDRRGTGASKADRRCDESGRRGADRHANGV
jgi:hypothetical protein